MRSIRNNLIIVAAGFAMLTTGCAALSRRSAPADAATTLIVRNNNFDDMNVYAVDDAGLTTRLGFARGETKTTLTVPRWVVGGATSLRVYAYPVGGASPISSGLLSVTAGDVITFMIEHDTALSTAMVRAR